MSGKQQRNFRKKVRGLADQNDMEGLAELFGSLPQGHRKRHFMRALINRDYELDFVRDYEATRERGTGQYPIVRSFKLTKGPEYYRLEKARRENESNEKLEAGDNP